MRISSTSCTPAPTIGEVYTHLNSSLETLDGWFSSKNLKLSAEKSRATLFMTWNREKNYVAPVSTAQIKDTS